MDFSICEKHNKTEKISSRVLINTYMCLNQSCYQHLQTFCQICKEEHFQHSQKVLTLEDIAFLIEQAFKKQSKSTGDYKQSIVALANKLKQLRQFKIKIYNLDKNIDQLAFELFDNVERIYLQHKKSRQYKSWISSIVSSLQEQSKFNQFKQNKREIFEHLQFDMKKEKFKFVNADLERLSQQNKKINERIENDLRQIQEYSMKIIEVILQKEEDEYQQNMYNQIMIKFGSMANYCYDHHDKNPIYEDYFDDLLDLKNADTTASKSNISILNENSNLSSWNDLETVSTIKSNRYNLNESIQIQNLKSQIDSLTKQNQEYANLLTEKHKELICLSQKNKIGQQKLKKAISSRLEVQKSKEVLINKLLDISCHKKKTAIHKI